MSWTDEEYNNGKKAACAALLQVHSDEAFLLREVKLSELSSAVKDSKVYPPEPLTPSLERGWDEFFNGYTDDLDRLAQERGDTVPTLDVLNELLQDFAAVDDNAEALQALNALIQRV